MIIDLIICVIVNGSNVIVVSFMISIAVAVDIVVVVVHGVGV